MLHAAPYRTSTGPDEHPRSSSTQHAGTTEPGQQQTPQRPPPQPSTGLFVARVQRHAQANFPRSPDQPLLQPSPPSPVPSAVGVAAPRASPSSSCKLAVVSAAAKDDGGFFNSFRRSFQPRTTTTAPTDSSAGAAKLPGPASHHERLKDLVLCEQEQREQLYRHEAVELTQMAYAVEGVLLPLIPALRDVNPLDLAQQEQVGRWSIWDNYFQCLLDATELQEMLHRRLLCRTEEPQQRKRIENGEVPHWIEARRLQVMRENQESAAAQNEEQVQRLAYFQHVQQQLYQVFLLEESERMERMEVERLQRLHMGGLAEVIAKEYRRVRLCQLRYEAARHPLCPSLSYEIAAEEGLHRSMLSQEQVHAFRSIQAAEVRDYLANIR